MTDKMPVSGCSIERSGPFGRKRRLVAAAKLTPADFDAIAAALGKLPVKARKAAPVAACRAQVRREFITDYNSEMTKNIAEPGDWIVTNFTRQGEVLRDKAGKENTYVIRADRFEELYARAPGESEFGPMFRAKAIVGALYLGGGLDIVAPWGERQTMGDGYLLRNGDEIYGNDRKSFESTYEVLT